MVPKAHEIVSSVDTKRTQPNKARDGVQTRAGSTGRGWGARAVEWTGHPVALAHSAPDKGMQATAYWCACCLPCKSVTPDQLLFSHPFTCSPPLSRITTKCRNLRQKVLRLKQTSVSEKMGVIQRGSRLSVQPVSRKEWEIIMGLGTLVP
jgi:hypothetical protein